MVTAPRIGFVVPVYRPPLDVFDAMLSSIRSQSMPDWECIVVDDGSRDPALTERLASAASDERFRVLVADRNGGIASATNMGIAALRAPVFAFVDHDDLLSHDAAEVVLSYFDDASVGVVYSDESIIDRDGVIIATHRKPDYAPVRLYGQPYMNHLTAARTGLIGPLRVRSEYEPTQDVDFLLRLIESVERVGQRVVHIPRQLYGWRAIDGSSAFDVAEKPGMVDAALRTFRAALERRGVDVDIENALDASGHPTASCVLEFPSPNFADIDIIRVGVESDVGSIVGAVVAAANRFVAFVPDTDAAPDEWVRVVASEAARDNVGMAGPCLVDTADRVVSTGRVVVPSLCDLFAGIPLDDGPFGANQVSREVSAVHPVGVVIDRDAFARAGIAFDRAGNRSWGSSLDVVVADWGLELQRRGLAVVWTPRARVTAVAGVPGESDRAAWERWVEETGQPEEHFSPSGSVPASGARQSRRQRLAQSTRTNAQLVATATAIDDSPAIAAAVNEALRCGRRVWIVGDPNESVEGLVAVGNAGASAESDAVLPAEWVRDVTTAVGAAIDQVSGATAAAVVVAGFAAELWSDSRLHAPIISGGVGGPVDGVSLIPVTPYPWPDWLGWQKLLTASGEEGTDLATRVRSLLFELGPEEPDPNVQIGVALGPLLVAITAAVVAAARRMSRSEVVLSRRVALIADSLELWRCAAPSSRDWLTVCGGEGTPERTLYVGWDALDRPPAGLESINIVGDDASFRTGLSVLSAGVLPSEALTALGRFLGDTGIEHAGQTFPGLEVTRGAALRYCEAALPRDEYSLGDVAGTEGARTDGAGTELQGAAQLVQRLLEGDVAEIDASIALWWDPRFDGPIPRRLRGQGWMGRYQVAGEVERIAMIEAVAGPVPRPLARRLVERELFQREGRSVAMLAAFERGSDEPVDDQRIEYGLERGVKNHRFRYRQSSLRAVAFSAAMEPGRVRAKAFGLRVTPTSGEPLEIDLLGALDGDEPASVSVVNWIETCPLDGHAWLQRSGGQVVIEFDRSNAPRLNGAADVEIEIEFEFEPVSPEEPLFQRRFEQFAQRSDREARPAGALSRLKRFVGR